MRPSVATVAALVAATIASLSHAPAVSAAPALRISDPDLGVVGGGRGVDTRLPYKLSKRDHAEEEDEVDSLSEDEETEEAFDVPADLLEDADVEDSVSSKGVAEEEEEEDVPKFATTSLDEATFNALAAGDYGASDSAAPAAGAPAAAAAAGPAAEAGSAPDSWDVALNMNPNDLPLLNNQAATTSKAGGNVQIGAPTDVNVDPNAATSTEQRQVGAPTDVNIDGTTRTTGAVQVGAPTDVNVDPNASTTTTTTKAGGNVQIGAPTDVNVDPNAGTTTTTTTTTMGAAPTQGGNNGGNNNIDNGEFECLEVLEDCNLQCKDVQSIDESQFNCSEDIDFGKDFMCTDAKGEEFDCTPLDGQTGAGSSGGSGDPNGSSSDPSYSGSQGADSNAAGLASSATSSWTSGVLKTGVVTAFVLVASAAFLL